MEEVKLVLLILLITVCEERALKVLKGNIAYKMIEAVVLMVV